MPGKLTVVGLGPGSDAHLTPAARSAIASAEVVVGYQTYLDFIPALLVGKELVSSGMMQEVKRCQRALEIAASGKRVALVCSGDAGVYGMAGLVLELVEAGAHGGMSLREVEIEIVPGISAVQAAAARLGAPLMHDFAVISLSDLLTPWPTIRQRLEAAATADFVVALYNPRSKGRITQIVEAQALLLASRPATTPVGIVRHACRTGEELVVSDLANFLDHSIDMFSLVIIGNSSTFVDRQGRMVTPRGYEVRAAQSSPPSPGGGRGVGEAAAGTDHSTFPPTPTLPREGGGSQSQTKARALFVGGTGSDVGKSVITAGLCRLLKRRGYRVAPFKAQNMALNSAVTPEGGEIGRAQALQATACGLAAHVDMNPILLKPNSHTGSQVVVLGRAIGNLSVAEYHAYKPQAFAAVESAFGRLAAQQELVVLEGAGSIAEINLKEHDIVNLRAAKMAQAPVLLVADIDRGGVFAAIVGTFELLTAEERRMIAGVIINRFRGDASLLASGIVEIERRIGVPVLGVIPWLDLHLPEEDSVALSRKGAGNGEGGLRIGVIQLPHLSNYTDFDPLEREPGVELVYLIDPAAVAGLDLLILPGSKSTIPDLRWLRQSGLARAIHDFHAQGGEIVGICGGYQMLGKTVSDPDAIESELPLAEGLGLLDVETVLRGDKKTHQVEGIGQGAADRIGFGTVERFCGYEIHLGETTLGPLAQPLLRLTTRSGCTVGIDDGAVAVDGRTWGTYLHGFFDDEPIRAALLKRLRAKRGLAQPAARTTLPLDQELDRLADHLEQHLVFERILQLLIPPGGAP